MNILEFLKEDHVKLRKELVNIRQNLDQPHVRDMIKHFISKYEIHESTEEEILFPVLIDTLRDRLREYSFEEGREEHGHIWVLLDQLIESLDTMSFGDFQKTFFQFVVAMEAHMGQEERALFPRIATQVSPDILEDLGRAAEMRFAHFLHS